MTAADLGRALSSDKRIDHGCPDVAKRYVTSLVTMGQLVAPLPPSVPVLE
ncbi:MAG: hypothetical protein Q8S33_31545 [Myxococcales bacterium]|nr:hypothetical protein [Myxococcales bacterium]MDP3504914.1 hypothetical protein [Myxococcales bacterium]